MDMLNATAGEIAAAVNRGELTAQQVCAHFLDRIEAFEPTIQAFAFLDTEDAKRQARDIDARAHKGPLAGVPVGVKDIYDTADMPTEFFSSIYAGNRPSRDAAVVALLRAAGAIVIGKTHTTEFAYMHTGPTRNPHDLSRTPGSSSAGSGAGMAAGFFPLALGSQTAGSLLKPASFCGVFAYKPTARLVSLEGVKPLAPSFDTVGWYGRSVDDLALVAHALLPNFPSAPEAPPRLRLAFANTPKLADVAPALREQFASVRAKLVAAGHSVDELALPEGFGGLYEHHRIVNDSEGARSLAHERLNAFDQLSEDVRAMMVRADAISWDMELSARQSIAALAEIIEPTVAGYDAVLDLSTGVTALSGLGTTGPSDFIKAWMCFGLPQVSLPAMSDADGLPFGLQLVTSRYRDACLLGVARAVALALDCPRLTPARLG